MEYSVIKTWWKGRYSTHIHISVIWFWKKTGRRARHSSQSRSRPPRIQRHHCVYSYERGKPSSPELGTPKYPTLMFSSSHQVCNSKILSGSSFKVLLPHYYSQISLRNKQQQQQKKWQFGIIQFLGVISTISVSLLSTRIMLQHITPLAYGSVKLSVVRFHHLFPNTLIP